MAEEARTVCAAEGASLFMPLNAQENNDFYSYTNSQGWNGVWLDGNDVAVEGEYRTSTGDLITFFNWYQPDGGWHQPDNSGGDEDYIHYFWHTTWNTGNYWNDWDNFHTHHTSHTICHKTPSRKSSCSKTTEVDTSAEQALNTMTVQSQSLIVTPSLFKLIFFYSSHREHWQCYAADWWNLSWSCCDWYCNSCMLWPNRRTRMRNQSEFIWLWSKWSSMDYHIK